MRFLVQQGRQSRVVKSYPTAVLGTDNWDDYGFKTMFHARLHLGPNEVIDLETVKIMHRGQVGGRTKLPGTSFDELLWGNFCSLGQSYSYYELLYELGESVYKPYLERLCDAAYSQKIRDAFRDTDGFRESLLRFDGAERALEDAALMFQRGGPVLTPALLDFTYRFPRVTTSVQFAVSGRGEVPGRVAAVIGYNGSGKTRLLANLARLACSARIDAEKDAFVDQVGEFIGPRPQFGSIIAVSYSAFDDFAVPDGVGNRASAQNYVYCGLRRLARADAPDAAAPTPKASATRSGGATGTWSGPTALKTFEEIADEFHVARARARRPDRRELLSEATQTLFTEPSFTTTVELPDIQDDEDSWIGTFAELSAGHKIVLNIVVALCAFVQPRSLVLIDEPELHLHPPLVAALLRAVGVTLNRYDSFAIVATHSPVVLQEVPASNVRVLRRYSDEFRIEDPESETFAENVGLLTRQIFNLNSSATDYEGVLTNLAARHTLDEIERMFPTGLSSQGRSLVLSLQQPPRPSGG
jgi:predicted ATPase